MTENVDHDLTEAQQAQHEALQNFVRALFKTEESE